MAVRDGAVKAKAIPAGVGTVDSSSESYQHPRVPFRKEPGHKRASTSPTADSESQAAGAQGSHPPATSSTGTSSLRTGMASGQVQSFWSAYSSLILQINSVCFLTAVDIACCAITAVIVAVLTVGLVLLTDQTWTSDSRPHRLESIIRGPFGVVLGIAQPVTGSGGGYAYAFLGIPYAQPPIGRLRFKAPLQRSPVRSPEAQDSLSNGTYVLNASQAGPACIQSRNPGDLRTVSEDCLHLNIWTPHPNCTERNLPACGSRTVLFFLHGDNFQEGGNNDPLLDARHLAFLGDVVVVIPNYRLGALGFLLDNGTEAPGNAGLYDQLGALAWVRSNIGHFGGNGSDVVAVGYGAGAASIGYLLFSNAMSGQQPTVPGFDRIIAMSQGPFCRYPESTSTYEQLLLSEAGRHPGCIGNHTQEAMQCLVHVARAVDYAKPGWPSFFPSFGNLLPAPPTQLASKVQLRNLRVLIGHVDNERDRLIAIISRQYLRTSETSDTPFLADVLAGIGVNRSSIEPMLDYYRQRYRHLGNIGRWRPYSLDILVDMLMVCPQRYFVDYLLKAAGGGNRVYRYLLSGAESDVRVDSVKQLEMLFGKYFTRPAEEAAQMLSRRIIQLWTDFAKKRQLPEIEKEVYDDYAFTLSDVTDGTSQIDRSGRLDIRREYCDFLKPHYM